MQPTSLPSSQINPIYINTQTPQTIPNPNQTMHKVSCTSSSNTIKFVIALAVISLILLACKNNIMKIRFEPVEENISQNIDTTTIHIDQEDVIKDPLFQEFE